MQEATYDDVLKRRCATPRFQPKPGDYITYGATSVDIRLNVGIFVLILQFLFRLGRKLISHCEQGTRTSRLRDIVRHLADQKAWGFNS